MSFTILSHEPSDYNGFNPFVIVIEIVPLIKYEHVVFTFPVYILGVWTKVHLSAWSTVLIVLCFETHDASWCIRWCRSSLIHEIHSTFHGHYFLVFLLSFPLQSFCSHRPLTPPFDRYSLLLWGYDSGGGNSLDKGALYFGTSHFLRYGHLCMVCDYY